MTAYLLDENVLKELTPFGNENVRAWYAAVSAADIYISVMTMFEKRRGWERLKRSKPAEAASMFAKLDALEAAYGENLVSIDAAIAAEWARLLGAKEKNQRDRALAATARMRGLILVTRNIADFRGCDVQVLNPFIKVPLVETV